MKAPNHTNPSSLPARPPTLGLRVLSALALLPVLVSLSGCVSLSVHTRKVIKTVPIANVLNATLAQLNERLAADYGAIQTISASVEMKATTGGQHKGEVKEIPSFSGHILMRKPQELFVLLQLPYVKSRAFEMVSDGKDFKIYIPPQNRAIEGLDQEVSTPSKNGLENLRPSIIRDALLVPAVAPDEFVNVTQNARIIPPAPGKKESTEEPDYDITVSRLKSKTGNVLETVRVIHIGRGTLRPYEQDIYDHQGRLVTVVTYDNYKTFGDVVFPSSIFITRPIDEFSLRIDVNKITFNSKLDDDQFNLVIPPSVPIQKM